MNSYHLLKELKFQINLVRTNSHANSEPIFSDLSSRVGRIVDRIPGLGSINTNDDFHLACLSIREAASGALRIIHQLRETKNDGGVITEIDINRLSGIFAELLMSWDFVSELRSRSDAGSKGGKACKRLDGLDSELEQLLGERPGISPHDAWENVPGDIRRTIKYKTFYQNYFLPAKKYFQVSKLSGQTILIK